MSYERLIISRISNLLIYEHRIIKSKCPTTDRQTDLIVATSFQGLTPNGAPYLLEIVVMGFYLCNALATFTRLMTQVLDPFIHLCVTVYSDGIFFDF
jgi:hypothetical protein